MRLFSCKVRLAGKLENEVDKLNVTAAEVILLRAIHGEDAISNFTELKPTERSDGQERERLALIYATTPSAVRMMQELLGPSHVELPKSIPGVPNLEQADAAVQKLAERQLEQLAIDPAEMPPLATGKRVTLTKSGPQSASMLA